MDSLPPTACGFDEVIRGSGLSPHEFQTSVELKEWVRKNRDEKCVPLELLEAWQFVVDEKRFTKSRQRVRKRSV
jgi:hypothetical protein